MTGSTISLKSIRYGLLHRRLRKMLAPHVAAGEVACARCGVLILPGEPWDLDHDDDDSTRYYGASHARCNRATSGRRKPKRRSRRW